MRGEEWVIMLQIYSYLIVDDNAMKTEGETKG